jgi:hypothetical protein
MACLHCASSAATERLHRTELGDRCEVARYACIHPSEAR